MIGFPLQKSPAEVLDRLVSFAHKLAATDVIGAPLVTVDDAALTATVVALGGDRRSVLVRVGAGRAGGAYTVSVQVATGFGDVLVERVRVEVV